MKTQNSKLKNQNFGAGFSIMEVVAAIGVFTVIFVSVYGSFTAGLKSLVQSRHRTGAAALANEKMEIIRNMPYADIGTVSGAPPGILPQNETVWKNNQRFYVHTFIRYNDDPDDGLLELDENHIWDDYKEAKVEVTWPGVSAGNGVAVYSRFVPDGVETDVGGGTLRFNAMDGSGAVIAGAAVRIANGADIDISTFTDANGSVLLSGLPGGDRNYEISVSKDGYESVVTLPPYPISSYDPTDVHASVIEGSLNTKAIIIDKLGDIHFFSKDVDDQAIPNVDFALAGGRVIGTDPNSGNEITNYNENHSTGASGDINVTDIPPGKYNVTLNEPGYTLIGSDHNFPLALTPDESMTVNLIIADNTKNSLVVTVNDAVSKLAVANATVRLTNGVDFDHTLITGQMGQVYFPPTTDPPTTMTAGDYTLEISADGYDAYSGNINVNQLTQTTVELNPTP